MGTDLRDCERFPCDNYLGYEANVRLAWVDCPLLANRFLRRKPDRTPTADDGSCRLVGDFGYPGSVGEPAALGYRQGSIRAGVATQFRVDLLGCVEGIGFVFGNGVGSCGWNREYHGGR
jgi:hypothetical protein